MKYHKECTNIFYGTFNTILFVCGLSEVVCGLWLLSDAERTLLSLLLARPEYALPHPPFYYAALGLLAVGLATCVTSALGYWITYVPGYITLTIYFICVCAVATCTCAGGALAALRGAGPDRGAVLRALQETYAMPDHDHFTAAVDLAQYQLECCGVSEYRDYESSRWRARRLGGPRALPPSCCVAAPAPRAPAAHLNPAPLDPERCQGAHPTTQYTHLTGCWDKLEDWYQKQYTGFMLAVFIVTIIKLTVLLWTVLNCVRHYKNRRDKHSYVMKSYDKKIKENVYETRMGRLSEEPITAKYIQPDTFYSPRVRNPRIFQSKPNEMI